MKLIALLLASSLTMLANTVIAPALPRIAEAFSASDPKGVHTRLLLTAPALVTIFAAPLAGFIGDRWKRLPVLIMGMLLFALFGTAGLWLNDLDHLLISRLLLGIPVGMMLATTSSLFGDYYTGQARTRAMGFQGMANSLGGMVFIASGGILSGISWRYPFAVYGIGALLALVAWKSLSEPDPVAAHGDGHGALQPTPWLSLFVVYMTALIGISAFFLIPVNIAFLLKERLAWEGAKVGLLMASSTGISAIVAWKYLRIKELLGRKRVFVLTFFSMALAMFILSQADTLGWFLVGMVFNGIGIGCMFPNTSGVVLELAPPHMRGRAIGLLSSFFFLGQFLSPVFTGVLVGPMGGVGGVFQVSSLVLLSLGLFYLAAVVKRSVAKS